MQHNYQPMDNDDQIFQYNYYIFDNEMNVVDEIFYMNLQTNKQTKKKQITATAKTIPERTPPPQTTKQ